MPVIVIQLLPSCRVMPLADQVAVPEQFPLPPRLLDQVTCVRPTESDAVPDKANGLVLMEYVGFVVGEVIVTTGGVVS